MNWLDLGIIIFLIIFVIIGIKQGFMTQMLANFTLGLNAFLSFFLCNPIRMLFDKIFGLSGAIAGSYSAKLLSASSDFGVNLLSIEEPYLKPFVSETLNKGNLPAISKNLFNFYINNDNLYTKLHESGLESRTLGDIVSQSYATFFSTIIAFITSMVLLFLLVLLFRFIANKLRSIGFIKIVDNTLGSLYGILRCFMVLIGFCLIIKLLSPFSFMNSVIAYINSSFFGKMIYSTINSFFDNFLNFNDLANAIFKH